MVNSIVFIIAIELWNKKNSEVLEDLNNWF